MAECKPPEEERGETRWKRFHPLRVVRKIFRRRMKRDSEAAKKSWSTSELQDGKPEVASSLKIGFSVSHDSIFSPESSAMSGEPLSSSPGSSLTVHHTTLQDMFKGELFSTVHVRRGLDDDGAAAHHSLDTISTAMEDFYTELKENSRDTSTSSLRKQDTSGNYEDSSEHSLKKSSRISLIERLSLDTDLSHSVSPLDHKAAHHKIAIRPKRTHGLPHHRKKQIAASNEHSLHPTREDKEDSHKCSKAMGTMKTNTEFSASTKNVSMSSHSSEWQVSSFSYKEGLSLANESFRNEVASGSMQVVKECFKSNVKNVSDQKVLKINDDYPITKGENQLNYSCIEKDEAGKSKLNLSDTFKDAIIDKEEYSSITTLKDFSQNIHTDLMKTNESPQEENMFMLKTSSVFKNLIDLKNAEEMNYARSDTKNTLNKSLESDLTFHKDNYLQSNMKDEYLLQSNLKEANDHHSSTKSIIETQKSKEGIRSDNFQDFHTELNKVEEPTFKDDKLFLEEDSIINTMSVRESGIYVSHHSSTQPDLINVTEAHNYATVENVLNQASESSWISSVDIMASKESNVNLNTSENTDDIITISVNSKSERVKSMISAHKKIEKPALPEPVYANISKPIDQQQSLKSAEKQEMSSGSTSTKNPIPQKRVSVEIVPFSQRMKERKYKPIPYAKNDLQEQGKKSSAVLEKKALVQKPSNKEVGKLNSRNVTNSSFSESSKEESAIVKKNLKQDQIQCPVQIRIQKSKINTVVKDKCLQPVASKKELLNKDRIPAMEVTSAQFEKLNQDNTPLLKDNKIQENAAKSLSFQNNASLNYNSANELSVDTSSISTEKHSTDKKVEAEILDLSLKPTSSEDPEPELLRVFARRSIKQKHCDKDKTPERNEENNDVTVSPNGTVIQIQETSKITKHELKKKSKSFCEKMTRAVSPLKEMNLIPGETLPKPMAESSSESIHPRQRLASVSDIQRTPVKEDLLGMDEPPSWLQLAQQRRELREQRERLLLGGSPNSFMDPSNKPARSSKVWDMVNNFQKLQMT